MSIIIKICEIHGELIRDQVRLIKATTKIGNPYTYYKCKKCSYEYEKKHYQNNPDKKQEKHIKYRKNHLKKVRLYQKKWQSKRRKEKPEYVNKMNMIYYHRNNEKMRLNRAKYRYGIKPEDYKRMYDDQKGMCKICNKENPDNKSKFLVIDHCHSSESKGIMKIRGLL